MEQAVLSALFSDETELFRFPSEPEEGQSVRIRLRAGRGTVSRAQLLLGNPETGICMRRCKRDDRFDWYEAEIVCPAHPVSYRFLVEAGGEKIRYQKNGAVPFLPDGGDDAELAFRFTPGFHVPAWAKGAVQYQIFTDRFCNGNLANDVTDNEYYYTVGHAKHVSDWNTPPTDTDIRCFYGGDLQGVAEKLDYLQDLGVEAIYFNPLFVSPSSHKYDVQDYEHIDPHIAVIRDDLDHQMQSWEKHNGYAPKYIRRVTSVANLEESDALFADLCREIHRRGMRVILDGVFNHCGSFNKWMDREGVYRNKPGFLPGAYGNPDSPYRQFFRFHENGAHYGAEYEGWWGYTTLPKLNYEGSEALCEEILSIAEKWAKPPYSIDGWRLDVAADVGHSTAFNHHFWKQFRKRLKAVNPDILILAEHYGDPTPWLLGDEWDTVMNYDAFMEPITYFLTGMEKHSDSTREDLYQNGPAFFDSMARKMARFEAPSLLCAMNELSNHDHSRFLTRTNRQVGRLATAGSAAAGEGVNKAVFREAVTVQMTWPGAPTVYYADEAGQVGWTDPDCRRTYPWGNEDVGLIDLHRHLIRLRREQPVLRTGSVKPLFAGKGQIAYARFTDGACAVIVCNNNETADDISIPVWEAGVPEGLALVRRLLTFADGFDGSAEEVGCVRGGAVSVRMLPYSSAVFTVSF